MSRQAAVCCNKVQVELKEEIESLSRQRVFCRDIAEEECKEDCRDTLNSVATLLTLSRQCSRKMENEHCHDNPSSVAT